MKPKQSIRKRKPSPTSAEQAEQPEYEPNPRNVPLNVDDIISVEYPLQEYDANMKLIGHLIFQKVIIDLRGVVLAKDETPLGLRGRRRKTIRRVTSNNKQVPPISKRDLVKLVVKSYDGKKINFYIRLFDIYLIAYQVENGTIFELTDQRFMNLKHVTGEYKRTRMPVDYQNLHKTMVGRGALPIHFSTIYHDKEENCHMALQAFIVMICESVRSHTCYKYFFTLLGDLLNPHMVQISGQIVDAALGWSDRSLLARRSGDQIFKFPGNIPVEVEYLYNSGGIQQIVKSKDYAVYAPYYCRIDICVPHIRRRRPGDSEDDF